MYKRLSGLKPNTTYSFNVLAEANDNVKVPYTTVTIRTEGTTRYTSKFLVLKNCLSHLFLLCDEDFKEIFFEQIEKGEVEENEYVYFQIYVENVESETIPHDNYYRPNEVKVQLTLRSEKGISLKLETFRYHTI
jgi:hypothetical protein